MGSGITIGFIVFAIAASAFSAYRLKLAIDEKNRKPRFVCPVCHHLMVHTARGKSSWGIATILWLVGLVIALALGKSQAANLSLAAAAVFWVIAIVYLVMTERRAVRACGHCRAMGVLPVNSRRGAELIQKLYDEYVDDEEDVIYEDDEDDSDTEIEDTREDWR